MENETVDIDVKDMSEQQIENLKQTIQSNNGVWLNHDVFLEIRPIRGGRTKYKFWNLIKRGKR